MSDQPRPGSIEEAEALELIDEARTDELRARGDTTSRRRRRHERAWVDRQRQIEGA